METKLDILLEKISNLEEDVITIKKELEEIKSQTTKMDSHVEFVNGVYETVEAPLYYVCNKVNTLLGKKNPKLKN